MRTISIIASAGLLAAAETPKPKPELSTSARVAMDAIFAQSKQLGAQSKQIGEQQAALLKLLDAIKIEECQRIHKLDKCDITDAGQVIPVPAKKEVKK